MLAMNLAVVAAQDPFSQVPPGYPNGQYPNGQPPRQRIGQPQAELSARRIRPRSEGARRNRLSKTATFGGPASPDAPNGIRTQEAKPFAPLYQSGQPVNGAVPANVSCSAVLAKP